MKKMLTIAVLSSLMGVMAVPAMAANDFKHPAYSKQYAKQQQKQYRKQQKAYRKYQQERLKMARQFHQNNRPVYPMRPYRDWQRGQVLASPYRGRTYWVDYRDHPRLYAPAKNQRWVRVNDDYVLVNTLSNVIVRILAGY